MTQEVQKAGPCARRTQIVFFDIDGTLLDHGHGSVIPRSTMASLKALQHKGIKVFVATGAGSAGPGVPPLPL